MNDSARHFVQDTLQIMKKDTNFIYLHIKHVLTEYCMENMLLLRLFDRYFARHFVTKELAQVCLESHIRLLV